MLSLIGFGGRNRRSEKKRSTEQRIRRNFSEFIGRIRKVGEIARELFAAEPVSGRLPQRQQLRTYIPNRSAPHKDYLS
jgi:hypothetical protein